MKIVVDENIPFAKEAFSTLGEVETSHGREITPQKVEDTDVLIVRSITKVNSKLLEKSTVKFVGTATIGMDHIDVEYLKDRDIEFVSAPGSNSNSVSEYIVCALLYAANKLSLSLKNLTLGIIGVGNVGSKVAKKANVLGMRVLLNDPPLFEKTGNIKYRPIQELIENCDILTFHVPLERQGKYPTYHMIDEKFLGSLKKCSVIINTSRGGVMDTEAVKNALMRPNISQIILDVWENEPDIDTEMLKMALIGTPHIAGYSFDGKVNGTFMIYNSLCQYLNKKAKWNPQDFLPKSNCPVIKVGELREVVSQVYDIEKDDSKLREIITMTAEKQGMYFDSLRKNYPVRREFFNTEVLLEKEDLELANILSGIGFKIRNGRGQAPPLPCFLKHKRRTLNMPWFYEESKEIDLNKKQEVMERVAQEASERITKDFKKVLLLPPDITRYHSGAGQLTEMIYKLLPKSCKVDVIPTLGQHIPHTDEENKWMFGSIPKNCFLEHDWRNGCKKIGEIPADYVKEVSEGKADWSIPVEINRKVVEEDYDLIVNIGHVVPHEVLGFANHNKNYFIGLGGKEMICASHMMAACCGIENNLGQLITPLRACYNKAENEYLNNIPHVYVQIVMARNQEGKLVTIGLYVGDDLETYLMAAKKSKEQNITAFDKPVKKIVAVMQADEFKSTWVANKAIYRTRMAIADGGELLIIAPGLERFGEQPEVDEIIRKYGYVGTPAVMEQYRKNADMQDLRHATAHLIHGSSEGRFSITYAPGKLTKEEIEGVNFKYADIKEALTRYNPEKMSEGWNTMSDGEQVFFISSPSAGLWAYKEKLKDRVDS